MEDKVFPLQQGALDCMCSIYAAINAMHVEGKIGNLGDAAVHFGDALEFMQTDKVWNLSAFVREGIDEEHCRELFQKLSGADWDVYPFSDGPDRLTKLADLLNGGAKAVVVSLIAEGAVLHYTVVTNVSTTHLTICDSQGKEIEGFGNNLRYDGTDIRLGYFYVLKDN